MRALSMGVVLLLSGCAASGPPARSVEQTEAMTPVPSVYALIGDRARIGLTSEQVEALDSIGEWLIAANSEANERLRQLGIGPLARPGGRAGIPEEVRPLMEELRRNNLAAMEGIEAVLTEEQKALVCERVGRRVQRVERDRAERGAAGDRRAAGAFQGAPQAWWWCAPPAAPADSAG